MPKAIGYTDQTGNAMVAKVDGLRKELSMKEACDQAGVSVSTYQWWKNGRKIKNKKPEKRAYRRRAKIQVEAAPAPHLVGQIFLWSDGNVTNTDFRRAA